MVSNLDYKEIIVHKIRAITIKINVKNFVDN